MGSVREQLIEIAESVAAEKGFHDPQETASRVTRRFPFLLPHQHRIEKIIYEAPVFSAINDGCLETIDALLRKGDIVFGWTDDYKLRFGQVVGDLRRRLPHSI